MQDYSLPITSLKNWFPKEVMKNKRANMARIIRELAQEQNPDKKFNFPDIEFTGTQSGYTDDDDDMDDVDYNKDLRPINRLPPTTSAILASTSVTCVPKIPSALNNPCTVTGNNDEDEDEEDEFDGADSDDVENAIPQKQVRAPALPLSKGK